MILWQKPLFLLLLKVDKLGRKLTEAGGMVWTGLAEPNPMLKCFVTMGTPEFSGEVAEHLKTTSELFEESMKRAGKITPPGKLSVH